MAPYLHYTIFLSIKIKRNKIGQTDFPWYNSNRKGAKRQRLAPYKFNRLTAALWRRRRFFCWWKRKKWIYLRMAITQRVIQTITVKKSYAVIGIIPFVFRTRGQKTNRYRACWWHRLHYTIFISVKKNKIGQTISYAIMATERDRGHPGEGLAFSLRT